MPGPPPDEMVTRFRPTEEPDPDDLVLVQMNVRVPRGMLRMVDDRRTRLGTARGEKITRDEWVRRVFEWALVHPPGTPVRSRHPRRRSR